jgi:hypothetical protein
MSILTGLEMSQQPTGSMLTKKERHRILNRWMIDYRMLRDA